MGVKKEKLSDEAVTKKRIKLGLVWDAKKEPEKVVEDCKGNLPVLKEVKGKAIITEKNQPANLMIEGDNYHVYP